MKLGFEDYQSQQQEGDFHYSDESWFEYTDNWSMVCEGVRCRTFAFKWAPVNETDGAFVEMLPGYRTPVQFVRSAHNFVEVPFDGKLVLLHVSADGVFSKKLFNSVLDTAGNQGGEVFHEVKQGDLMCWYCFNGEDSEKPQIGKIVEYETPGFESAELLTVTRDSPEVGGKIISKEFWEAIDLIDADRGDELDRVTTEL